MSAQKNGYPFSHAETTESDNDSAVRKTENRICPMCGELISDPIISFCTNCGSPLEANKIPESAIRVVYASPPPVSVKLNLITVKKVCLLAKLFKRKKKDGK